MNWHSLFPIIFLFSCVDGFISNWLYPAKLPLLYKDFFILFVYLLFFVTKEQGRHWASEFKGRVGGPSWYLAIALIFWGALQIFNPHVPGILVGVLGFKTMFFYWPLALLAYAYIDSLDTLERLLKMIVYFSIPICLFGLFQFFQSPEFMVRVFGEGFKRAIVMASAGTTRSDTFMRVFGTFAASGQFTCFLVLNSMFILALLFVTTNKSEKMIMSICFVLNYTTLLCTGSRAGFLLLFGVTFIFVVLCRWLWRTYFIILLLAISFSFGFHYLGKGVIGRFQTAKDVKMLKGRTFETSQGMFKNYLRDYPFGKGMGSASGASRHIYKESPTNLEFVENYPTKLQCELGIVGVIFFYLLLLSLFIHWARYWVNSDNQRAYIFIAALTATCWSLFCFALFGIIDNPPFGIFLWTEIGIVAKLTTFQSDDQYPLST